MQLSEVTYRGHRRQWRTPDLPAGTAGPAGRPVAVPASGRTFSCGEALAYHLQARGRVTIAGERTPGAAGHVTGIRRAAAVTGDLPSGYCTDSVTGTSWEGRGAAPQADCAAADAIDAALARLPALKRRQADLLAAACQVTVTLARSLAAFASYSDMAGRRVTRAGSQLTAQLHAGPLASTLDHLR